jgi:hypothetical protein
MMEGGSTTTERTGITVRMTDRIPIITAVQSDRRRRHVAAPAGLRIATID